MAGIKRLQKEYRDLMKEPMDNCIAKPLEDNLFEWRFIFKGEKETPYENGIYMGKISLPKEYPAFWPRPYAYNKVEILWYCGFTFSFPVTP